MFSLIALSDGSEAAAPEVTDFDLLPVDCEEEEEEDNPYDGRLVQSYRANKCLLKVVIRDASRLMS